MHFRVWPLEGRLTPLNSIVVSWTDMCVFASSVYVNVYLLINVVILVVLQAAGGLCGVREGGTLRVVLRAPETIFPQLVTFCKMDGQNREMCYQGWVIPLLNDTQSHIISHT